MLEAYLRALEDRSDFQVECAVDAELRTPSGKPIPAASLRELAKNYPRSAEEAERREREARQRERLPAPPKEMPTAEYAAHRQAMRDECQRLIDTNHAGQAAPGSFAREMLEVLAVCDGDPTQEVHKVLFGIRQRRKAERQQTRTGDDLRHAIAQTSRGQA